MPAAQRNFEPRFRYLRLMSMLPPMMFLGAAVVAQMAGPPPSGWTLVASEGGSFTITSTRDVRYGASARWVQKSVSGAAQCSNAFFGQDPLDYTAAGRYRAEPRTTHFTPLRTCRWTISSFCSGPLRRM